MNVELYKSLAKAAQAVSWPDRVSPQTVYDLTQAVLTLAARCEALEGALKEIISNGEKPDEIYDPWGAKWFTYNDYLAGLEIGAYNQAEIARKALEETV